LHNEGAINIDGYLFLLQKAITESRYESGRFE
jgi:hypothetical protein